jgi:hypothetical protein
MNQNNTFNATGNPGADAEAPRLDLKAALGFIKTYPAATGHKIITLCALMANKRGMVGRSFDPTDHEAIGRWLTSVDAFAEGIYFGVNEAAKIIHKKLEARDIFRAHAAYIDLDPNKAEVEKPGGLERERERLMTKICELYVSDIPPTVVVDSGGGYHAYWLFAEPICRDAEDESNFRRRAECASIELQHVLGSDSVSNVDRVMRLPGTVNRKPGRKPALAKIIDFNDYRYTTQQIIKSKFVAERLAQHSGQRPREDERRTNQDKPRKSVGTGDVAAGFGPHGWQGDPDNLDPLDAVDRALDAMPELFRRVAGALMSIDCASITDYDDWIDIIIAAAGATGHDETFYRLVLEPWALAYPDNTPEIVRQKWDSIHETKIGWRALQKLARKHGWKDPNPDAEREVEHKDLATGLMGRFVYVTKMARFVELSTRELRTKEMVNDLYAIVWDPSARKGNGAAHRYLRHEERRLVDLLTYRPGEGLFLTEEGKPAFNVWRPSDLAPESGDVTPWLRIVERIIPDKAVSDACLDWMAFNLQHPGEKLNWHLLLGGMGGIGKDAIFVPLCLGLGASNHTVLRASDVNSAWSDFMEKKLLLVEELKTFEGLKLANQLKSFEAAPPYYVRINKKNVPQYDVPNLASFVYFTNYRDAIPLDDDERRHLIYWSPYRKPAEGTPERAAEDLEFKDYFVWLAAKGAAHVVHWLLQRDLSAFKPGGHAMFTQSKAEMIREGKSEVERWVIEAVEDEKLDDLVTVEGVIGLIETRASRLKAKANNGSVIRGLRSAGAVQLARLDLNSGTGEKRKAGDGRRKRNLVRPWAVRDTKRYERLTPVELRDAWQKQQAEAEATVRP